MNIDTKRFANLLAQLGVTKLGGIAYAIESAIQSVSSVIQSAAALGIRTADPDAPKYVGLVRAVVRVAGSVEHLADLNSAT